MKKGILLILLCLLAVPAFSLPGENYPAASTPVTANIGTTDTTVTSNATGYWFIKPEQDMYVNFGAAATTAHPLLDAGVWISFFPIRVHGSGSALAPASVHFLAKTTTGNITGWVVQQKGN